MKPKTTFFTEMAMNLVIFSVSAWLHAVARGYTQFTTTKLGAGTFPKGVSLLLMAFALVNMAVCLLKYRRAASELLAAASQGAAAGGAALPGEGSSSAEAEAAPEAASEASAARFSADEQPQGIFSRIGVFLHRNRVFAAIGLLALYSVLLLYAGFIVSTLLYLIAMLLLLDHRFNVRLFIIPVAATAFLYIAFKILLKVPLPSGLF